jgi:uncharacterized protein
MLGFAYTQPNLRKVWEIRRLHGLVGFAMIGFIYGLRDAGVPVSVQYVLELYRALRQGLATDIDRLFLLTRLIFVKRVEHYDAFERVFASYFMGAPAGEQGIGFENILDEKPFRDWLKEQLDSGRITPDQLREFDREELIRRFWETVLAQQGEHHGGNTWVGSRGRSPFGHSGQHAGGIRVHGRSLYGTAQKVIEDRRYINYSDESRLAVENLHQVLTSLKSLQPTGAEAELDVDESIAKTAANGGEIELIFRRELQNRLRLIVMLDNGGYSMMPHVTLVKTVFNKIRGVFRDVSYYYFHNCIYGTVYRDPARTRPVKWETLLGENRSTRLILIGDANMAPYELMASYGSLNITTSERKPGREWLKELHNAFPVSVWLNPIPQSRWHAESSTIGSIGRIFHMDDLTLAGIRRAVAYLNLKGQDFDRYSS